MKIWRAYNLKIGDQTIKIVASSSKWIKEAKRSKPEDVAEALSENWHDVDSSFIQAIAYDPASRMLSIRLTKGGVYVFDDVPKKVFKEFLNSGSKGRYFNEIIKKRY